MFKSVIGALITLGLWAVPASAGMDCEKEFDALSKAVSGPVTMSAGHRAAMMRMAVSSYDHCMAGDYTNTAGIRDMIMKQIGESLGGK